MASTAVASNPVALSDEEMASLENSALTDEQLQALEAGSPTTPPVVAAPEPPPSGAAPQQELSFAEKVASHAPDWMMTGNRAMKGIVQGAADPSVGAAQMAARALGADGVTQGIANQEKAYQQDRGPGTDWYRMTGNIVAPTNVLGGAALPVVKGLGGATAQGSGLGAVSSFFNPIYDTTKDFWTQKAKETGMGFGAGAIAPALVRGAANVISPKLDDAARALNLEGVRTTVGQKMGGAAKSVEDMASYVPVIGDLIRSSRREGVEDFNRATYNRVLRNLGEAFPSDAPVGNTAIQKLADRLDDAYESVFKNVKLDALPVPATANTPRIGSYLYQLTELRKNSILGMEPAYITKYDKLMNDAVYSRVAPNGSLSGADLNTAMKQLRATVQELNGPASQNMWTADIRDTLKKAGSTILNSLEHQNPGMAAELKATRAAWHDYAIVRDAAALKEASTTGIFTPSQLQTSVSATTKKLNGQAAGKGQLAKGTARMQDLANLGRQVMPPTYPEASSTGRALLGLTTIGGGVALAPLAPKAVLGGLAAAGMYAPGARWVANKALTARPPGFQPFAGALRQTSPLFGAAGAQFSQPSKK